MGPRRGAGSSRDGVDLPLTRRFMMPDQIGLCETVLGDLVERRLLFGQPANKNTSATTPYIVWLKHLRPADLQGSIYARAALIRSTSGDLVD
jgi:hypothetical protein